MGASRFGVLPVAALLSSVLSGGPADPPTTCAGREVFRVTPGLSLTEPTAGTIATVGEPGREVCTGPIEGHRPTGIIQTRHSAAYGYLDPDTCSALEVSAYADHTIPTSTGPVTFRNTFTASFKLPADGVAAGAFEGDYFSGRFVFRPLEGDCITAPITMFEGYWVGTWHGELG